MTLDNLIASFQKVDERIVSLIARRMELAKRIGTVKKRLGMPIRSVKRERAAIARARVEARKLKVSPDLVERIMKILITASRDIQHHGTP